MTTKYLVIITGIQYMEFPKNKLEREVYDFLKQYDRVLVDKKQLKAFKALISTTLSAANKKYAAYNEFPTIWNRVYQTDKYQDHKISMGVGRSCTFTLYLSSNKDLVL
jgi:hypothetical protein